MESNIQQRYLQAILQRCIQTGTPVAGLGDIATLLNVNASAVTGMMQRLAALELVSYLPYRGVELTELGLSETTRYIRKQRIIKVLLHRVLGLGWADIEGEFEALALAASDALIDRMDSFLGFPQFDPLGQPIPRRNGSLPQVPGVPLSSACVDDHFKVVSVVQYDTAVLRYLQESGFIPGLMGIIVANHVVAGVMVLRTATGLVTIARELSAGLFVEISNRS